MPGKLQFDASRVRDLVRRQLETRSLREIADEIGLSKSGLDSFLRGRNPYSRNRVKLAAWMMRQRHPTSASVGRDEVDAAIALLERYIDSVGSTATREKRVREVASRLFKREGPTAH
jgi:hypothetical protein